MTTNTQSRCIGATGAQTLAVIDGLLKPTTDGACTARGPWGKRARELADRGVQILQRWRARAYGAFVNTDSLTIGEEKQVYTGMRIFELVKRLGTLKHYVWSGLDYSVRKGRYSPIHGGKARASDWVRAQSFIPATMVCMEMLQFPMLGPLSQREGGTYVFDPTPLPLISKDRVPMVTLADVKFFAQHMFDNRAATSAQELEVASDWVDWPYLVSTFTKREEWFGLWDSDDINLPLVYEKRHAPDGSTTWKENFTRWWSQ
ncbi:hypothetical protein GY45DRAFT_1349597 [Cubamyces sp. BRFM 1775]|nr:hypothetical protein GY45DRAFT_1349597 [Cubamyces sp. BRFM 1775]